MKPERGGRPRRENKLIMKINAIEKLKFNKPISSKIFLIFILLWKYLIPKITENQASLIHKQGSDIKKGGKSLSKS